MEEDQQSQTEPDTNTFEIRLKDSEHLLVGLHGFKKVCDSLEKNRKRSCKKRFYELGLVARVSSDTTDEDLCKLLINGALTFVFDLVTLKQPKLSELVQRTVNAIGTHRTDETKNYVATGLAFEITGDCCRLGRNRNDCSIMLCRGDVLTLTTDEAYHWCGYMEVCYVVNLRHYLKNLRLHDVLKIGDEVVGRVVKKLNVYVAVLIDMPGLINSFDYIELPKQCAKRTVKEAINIFIDDLEMAKEMGANYIVMPRIRCKTFLQTLREYMALQFEGIKLIGSLDLVYLGARKIDLGGIIKCLDYLWIRDFFRSSCFLKVYICQCVVPKAKASNIPIIATVPLQCCDDFKCFSNNVFLGRIDSMFIEKSCKCNKYPLIVRRLLPIQNTRSKVIEKKVLSKNVPKAYQSRIHFIINSISKTNCQAIFLNIGCKAATEALRSIDFGCPVYVMLACDTISSDDDELKDMLNLSRAINLRRNLRVILFSIEMNENNYTTLDYGIEYALERGCINLGDFIITVDLNEQVLGGDKDEEGASEGIMVMRAFYVS